MVAGSGSSFVEKLIDRSKGDIVIDYRPGPDHLVEQLNKAIKNAGQAKVKYALDSVTQEPSFQVIAKVLDPNGGRYTGVLPYDKSVGKGLKDGWFTGHPFEVVPNGLAGVEGALKNLKDGKNSALKYVFRIAETPQLKNEQSHI